MQDKKCRFIYCGVNFVIPDNQQEIKKEDQTEFGDFHREKHFSTSNHIGGMDNQSKGNISESESTQHLPHDQDGMHGTSPCSKHADNNWQVSQYSGSTIKGTGHSQHKWDNSEEKTVLGDKALKESSASLEEGVYYISGSSLGHKPNRQEPFSPDNIMAEKDGINTKLKFVFHPKQCSSPLDPSTSEAKRSQTSEDIANNDSNLTSSSYINDLEKREELYTCDYCCKSFQHMQKWQWHLMWCTERIMREESQLFMCTHCGKNFLKASSLQVHVQRWCNRSSKFKRKSSKKSEKSMFQKNGETKTSNSNLITETGSECEMQSLNLEKCSVSSLETFPRRSSRSLRQHKDTTNLSVLTSKNMNDQTAPMSINTASMEMSEMTNLEPDENTSRLHSICKEVKIFLGQRCDEFKVDKSRVSVHSKMSRRVYHCAEKTESVASNNADGFLNELEKRISNRMCENSQASKVSKSDKTVRTNDENTANPSCNIDLNKISSCRLTKQKKTICKYCKRMFTNEGRLLVHKKFCKKKFEIEGSASVKCLGCSMIFPSKYTMMWHYYRKCLSIKDKEILKSRTNKKSRLSLDWLNDASEASNVPSENCVTTNIVSSNMVSNRPASDYETSESFNGKVLKLKSSWARKHMQTVNVQEDHVQNQDQLSVHLNCGCMDSNTVYNFPLCHASPLSGTIALPTPTSSTTVLQDIWEKGRCVSQVVCLPDNETKVCEVPSTCISHFEGSKQDLGCQAGIHCTQFQQQTTHLQCQGLMPFSSPRPTLPIWLQCTNFTLGSAECSNSFCHAPNCVDYNMPIPKPQELDFVQGNGYFFGNLRQSQGLPNYGPLLLVGSNQNCQSQNWSVTKEQSISCDEIQPFSHVLSSCAEKSEKITEFEISATFRHNTNEMPLLSPALSPKHFVSASKDACLTSEPEKQTANEKFDLLQMKDSSGTEETDEDFKWHWDDVSGKKSVLPTCIVCGQDEKHMTYMKDHCHVLTRWK